MAHAYHVTRLLTLQPFGNWTVSDYSEKTYQCLCWHCAQFIVSFGIVPTMLFNWLTVWIECKRLSSVCDLSLKRKIWLFRALTVAEIVAVFSWSKIFVELIRWCCFSEWQVESLVSALQRQKVNVSGSSSVSTYVKSRKSAIDVNEG